MENVIKIVLCNSRLQNVQLSGSSLKDRKPWRFANAIGTCYVIFILNKLEQLQVTFL